MSKHSADQGSKAVALPPASSNDFDVLWETKTFHVTTSGAPAPFPIKVLHGYRRYNVTYVVSPEIGHQTVLAVHGVMHNALVFQPLGHELLSKLSNKTKHFYSISLPGHGDTTPGSRHGVSGIPGPKLFGQVTLEDYAEALTQVAKQIGHVHTIVAHSQGGIVVQVAEKLLQLAGSSLQSATQSKTNRIVLLASTTPDEVSWFAADNDYLTPILVNLGAIKTTPQNGTFLSITDMQWRDLFYLDGTMPVAGGPDPTTQVPRLRTDEPSAAASVSLATGQPGQLHRPSIPANLFASFSFRNIAFEADTFLTAADLNGLGNHLKPGSGHILITSQSGAPAIHCALYTRPGALVPYLVGGDDL
ncbi:MAG TPA: alpha/beta hydrolase [Haliangium sp.]|nr:alpha/beta hydrolase [Haliangium sp.]